jgi:hypothetical protein
LILIEIGLLLPERSALGARNVVIMGRRRGGWGVFKAAGRRRGKSGRATGILKPAGKQRYRGKGLGVFSPSGRRRGTKGW